jgi:hypothetical protein
MAMWSIFAGMLMLIATASSALAIDVVKTLKPQQDTVRYAYHFELLDEVLKKTVAQYGNYVEQPYTAPMSSARQNQEAVEGKLINVLISDVGHQELDEGMIPVQFPIDKGLLGYRVALIAMSNQNKINSVNNIEQLRTLIVGQGTHWGDVRIYEYNHVPIETVANYESLFPMLLRGRFDLFPRGVTEVLPELAAYRGQYPDLAIEEHLLIKYPFAQYFYVSKSELHLAERIKDGLEQMAKDGSFDTLFNKHFAKSLIDLRLGQRTVIELENPFLPESVPFGRKELWIDAKKF